MRASEIYKKSKIEKKEIFKKYESFLELFAEIVQSEVKFFGSLKKIPFNTIVETSKVAYEYMEITEGGYGAKKIKGSTVNGFKEICELSTFNYLKNVEQYKHLIKFNYKMESSFFKDAEFKYFYNKEEDKILAKGKYHTFWEDREFEYSLFEVESVLSSYSKFFFAEDDAKFMWENERINFDSLYLKVISIKEEEKEVEIKWNLQKKSMTYYGRVIIPGTLKKLKKGKKLHLYGKEISYKDYLKNSKIKITTCYGVPNHVAKWVKAQILNGKAMNAM